VASTSASLGSAWIQVTADASNVADSMQHDVSDAVKQIAKLFEQAFSGVETNAEDAAGEVSDSLGKGAAEGTKKMADEAQGGSGAFVDKIKGIAITAAAAFGASFVIGNYLDMSSASDMLDAQLGAFGEDAGTAGRVAGEIYSANFGDSLDQVSEATKAVVQGLGIGLTADQFKPVTEGVLNVANAFGQDLQPTVNAVAQLMRTGLAQNAQQALDIITVGFQTGAGQTDDYLDTLNEYSVQFQKLGLDGATATGLLVQGLQAGARNTDLVADAFKEFSIRAVDGSKTTAQGFQAIGLDAEEMAGKIAAGGPTAAAALQTTIDALRNMEDPVQRSQAAVALFGTQAEDLGTALYALDPATAGAVGFLDDTKGAAEDLGTTMSDNLGSKIEGVKRQIGQDMTIALGSLISGFQDGKSSGDGIAGTFSSIGAAVRDATTWISEHEGVLRTVATVIGVVLLPIMAAWGTAAVVNAAKNVGAWLSVAFTSQGAAAATERSAAQVGLGWLAMGAQAVIQGVKIAAVWLAQIVGAAVSGAASFVVQVARVVGGWILMGAQSLIQAARMAAAWVIAMGPVGWIIALIVGLVALIIANWDTVKQWTVDAWNAVVGAIQAAWDWVVGIVTGAVNWVVDFVTGLPQRIWDGLVALGQMLADLATTAWQMFSDAVTTAVQAVVDFVTGLPQRIWDGLIALGQMLADLATAAWQWFSDAVSAGVQAVIDYVTAFPGNFIAGLGNLGQMLADVATTAWQWFYDNVVSKAGELISWLGGLPGRLISAIGDLGGLLLQKGRDLIQGLVNGISNAASFVGDVAKNVVNAIIGFINDKMIDGINNLLDFTIAGIHINVPDIPHIPKLADGQIVHRSTLAIVGEAGPEAVIPLSPARANRRAALMEEAGLSGGGRQLVYAPNITVPKQATAAEAAALIQQRLAMAIRLGDADPDFSILEAAS
jgi:phage-related minor tail protein